MRARFRHRMFSRSCRRKNYFLMANGRIATALSFWKSNSPSTASSSQKYRTLRRKMWIEPCSRLAGHGKGWRLTPPFERAAACHRIADRILARKEQIATIISLEQGKPYFAEALPEVEETAENFRIAAEDVKRLETPIIPARDPNKRLFTFKVAIGTWGIITPWNFPTVIPSEYFGPWHCRWQHHRLQARGANASRRLVPGAMHGRSGFASRCIQPGDRAGTQHRRRPRLTSRNRWNRAHGRDAYWRYDPAPRWREKAAYGIGRQWPANRSRGCGFTSRRESSRVRRIFQRRPVCCATERVLVDRRIQKDFLDLVIQEAKNVRVGDPLERAFTWGR